MDSIAEWDRVYRAGKQLSVFPWSDVVSYVKRYVPIREKMRVLELGFGAGANISFFRSLNADYWGIEGSRCITDKVKEAHPYYAEHLFCGNFFENELPEGSFDLILDRGSTYASTEDRIIQLFKRCRNKLTANGILIGIDWFSTKHSDYNNPECEVVDELTRKNYRSGQFKDSGIVHFCDEKCIRERILAGYSIKVLEHKTSEMLFPEKKTCAMFNVMAVLK